MASVIESDDELTGNREQVSKEPAELTQESTKQHASEQPKAPAEDKLGKFKGKTPEEIAAAYAELEQRFGSQGAEIGELRKFTDSLIRSDLERRTAKQEAPSKTEPQAADDDALFFINPKAAIKKALEESDLLKELAQHKTETQQERARRVTLEKHPEADDLVRDPAFTAWVQASRVRSNLFADACNFDVDAADELFSTFKEIKAAKSATPAQGSVAPDTAIVDAQKKAAGAAVGTAGGGQGGDSGKPVYSRRKIMDLMRSNPDEYAARSDEFLAAYAEGRVKP